MAAAKAAIVAGDRVRALTLLDGLRERPAEEGRQLSSAVADALVATARGEHTDRQTFTRALKDTHTALHQISEWLDTLPFDSEDLDQVAAAVATRRRDIPDDQRDAAERPQLAEGTAVRALGAGWLEWRCVEKPSGKKFGPYVYYRWRDGGRKRTKYVGKVRSSPHS